MKEYTYKDDSQVFEEVQTLTLTKKKKKKIPKQERGIII